MSGFSRRITAIPHPVVTSLPKVRHGMVGLRAPQPQEKPRVIKYMAIKIAGHGMVRM